MRRDTRHPAPYLSAFVVASLAFVAAVLAQSPAATARSLSETSGNASSPFATDTPPHARLLFVGDMFFDRYIRETSQKRGLDHPFGCIDPFLASADVVIGNLEGPITDAPSVSVGSAVGSADNYRFTFPTTTASLLARHNVRIVDIGNNHIVNFGHEGMIATKRYLTEANVGYFGGVLGDEAVLESEIGGVPIAFVSYNAFLGTSTETVARLIEKEKEAGWTVIVFAHWGEEYSTSTRGIREIATRFVASGAALVVGAHPHVALSNETIDGVPVYYSLGNFIFDQYWDERVRTGLALAVDTDGARLSASSSEVYLESDGRTCLK